MAVFSLQVLKAMGKLEKGSDVQKVKIAIKAMAKLKVLY